MAFPKFFNRAQSKAASSTTTLREQCQTVAGAQAAVATLNAQVEQCPRFTARRNLLARQLKAAKSALRRAQVLDALANRIPEVTERDTTAAKAALAAANNAAVKAQKDIGVAESRGDGFRSQVQTLADAISTVEGEAARQLAAAEAELASARQAEDLDGIKRAANAISDARSLQASSLTQLNVMRLRLTEVQGLVAKTEAERANAADALAKAVSAANSARYELAAINADKITNEAFLAEVALREACKTPEGAAARQRHVQQYSIFSWRSAERSVIPDGTKNPVSISDHDAVGNSFSTAALLNDMVPEWSVLEQDASAVDLPATVEPSEVAGEIAEEPLEEFDPRYGYPRKDPHFERSTRLALQPLLQPPV